MQFYYINIRTQSFWLQMYVRHMFIFIILFVVLFLSKMSISRKRNINLTRESFKSLFWKNAQLYNIFITLFIAKNDL